VSSEEDLLDRCDRPFLSCLHGTCSSGNVSGGWQVPSPPEKCLRLMRAAWTRTASHLSEYLERGLSGDDAHAARSAVQRHPPRQGEQASQPGSTLCQAFIEKPFPLHLRSPLPSHSVNPTLEKPFPSPHSVKSALRSPSPSSHSAILTFQTPLPSHSVNPTLKSPSPFTTLCQPYSAPKALRPFTTLCQLST